MKAYGNTNVGLVRKTNEDCYFISNNKTGPFSNLFIVADGMGGHNAGEIASKLAIESFVTYVNAAKDYGVIENLLMKATQYANKAIFEQANNNELYYGMGTTLVALCVIEEELLIINVGDSRLYVLDEELKQITIDHSYVEELVRAGEITREESIHHPSKNKITKALGVFKSVYPDIYRMSIKDIKRILLCTDGLTNMVNDTEITEILNRSASIQGQGDSLIQTAMEYGGTDNITFILIDTEKGNDDNLKEVKQ